ncbi:hypothetical protein CEXT_780161 [Caerostris extrusa]|uniref:Cuticle protein 16.8 n=1 Tax=Caerostris extrusa TaxID=172846 RepID=A0AAV4S9Z6_CAEEX|nr:hypothetical protein CEXT_780161 [Caerostris extrusa]
MFILAVFSCIALAQAQLYHDNHDHHHHHHAQPYKFGYSVKDHHGEQHREESGNGAGGVVGSYGFTDARGIARQVNYVADHAGFRAQVKTNEPGTANQNPAAVHLISNAPYAHSGGVALSMEGLDMEDMVLDMEDMVLDMEEMVLEMEDMVVLDVDTMAMAMEVLLDTAV